MPNSASIDEQAARRARRHGRERAVFGRRVQAARAEEFRRGARGRDAERVDRAHVAAARIEDQRLGLAAPGERVPHRGGRGQHRAGRVDGVAAARERQRTGGRGQRLARDGDPMLAVQRGLCASRALPGRCAAQRTGPRATRPRRPSDDRRRPRRCYLDHGPSVTPAAPAARPGRRHAAAQPVECVPRCPNNVPDELALFPVAASAGPTPPRRRSRIGCGPSRSTISWVTRSCSGPANRCAKRSSKARSQHGALGPAGLRQDDARASARALHRQRVRNVQRRDRRRAARARDHSRSRAAPPSRRTRHDSVLRRDPPLQPGAARRVPAVRRGRSHHARRRDHRESVVRAELRSAVAPARVRARAAGAGCHRAIVARARRQLAVENGAAPELSPKRSSCSCVTPTATRAAR